MANKDHYWKETRDTRQRDPYDDRSWSQTARQVDLLIRSAIETCVEAQGVKLPDLALGFSELGRFYENEDPNYSHPGTAVAYAFKYLPRRVSLLLASFDYYESTIPISAARVLNIGSGSGASEIAIDLHFERVMDVGWFVEPSQAMMRFAQSLRTAGKQNIQYEQYSVEQFSADRIFSACSDVTLFVLSACFQYSHQASEDMDWLQVATQFSKVASRDAVLLCIEPANKAGSVLSLCEALLSQGWTPVRESNAPYVSSRNLLPQVRKKNVILRRCTELIDRWYERLSAHPMLTEYGRHTLGETYRGRLFSEQQSMFLGDVLPSPWFVSTWNDTASYREVVACLVYRPEVR